MHRYPYSWSLPICFACCQIFVVPLVLASPYLCCRVLIILPWCLGTLRSLRMPSQYSWLRRHATSTLPWYLAVTSHAFAVLVVALCIRLPSSSRRSTLPLSLQPFCVGASRYLRCPSSWYLALIVAVASRYLRLALAVATHVLPAASDSRRVPFPVSSRRGTFPVHLASWYLSLGVAVPFPVCLASRYLPCASRRGGTFLVMPRAAVPSSCPALPSRSLCVAASFRVVASPCRVLPVRHFALVQCFGLPSAVAAVFAVALGLPVELAIVLVLVISSSAVRGVVGKKVKL